MEGLYREFVRSLQVLRKEADFEIDQRIVASFESKDEKLKKLLSDFEDKIKQEVLISKIENDIKNPTIERKVEVGDGEIYVKFVGKE